MASGVGRKLALALAALGLAGCSGPIGMYHNIQGGAIAEPREPPPGADAPYPNLASVPPAPVAMSAAQNAGLNARLQPDSAAIPATDANPEALAGLSLPAAPPPPPDVPGLQIPQSQPVPAAVAPRPPPTPTVRATAPVVISFRPHSAILSADMLQALQAMADSRNGRQLMAGGFGGAAPDEAMDASALNLGVARAAAIADALTAAGVPASAIAITAAPTGAGGFVQIIN